jgi:hypothetical protein
MSNVTPRPWAFSEQGESVSGNDGIVCVFDTGDYGADEHDTLVGEDDARHIVKCVNYHERLVEALEEVCFWAESYPGMPSTGHFEDILDELKKEPTQ